MFNLFIYFSCFRHRRFLHFQSQTLLWLLTKTKFAAINELGNKYDWSFTSMKCESLFIFSLSLSLFSLTFALQSIQSVCVFLFIFVFVTKPTPKREHINCSRRWKMYHFLFLFLFFLLLNNISISMP